MISSYNSNLFSAHNVLKYGNLLNIGCLEDIKVDDLVVNVTYTLCFDLQILKHKKLYKLVKHLITLEPNYCNAYIQEHQYRIVFIVPKKYKDLVLLRKTLNKKVICDKDICNITTLRNKKAPSTVR